MRRLAHELRSLASPAPLSYSDVPITIAIVAFGYAILVAWLATH